MSFHIVCDSCTDLTEEDLKKGCYTLVPLTLLVDGEEIIDDETFDQADFLAKVAASKESVKSACPAPESYMEAYSKADDIYVVTLSAELSGSYNSAVLGKNLYEEEKEKIFSLVKGKKTPLSFQFVMMLKPDLSPEFLAKYNLAVREDEIAGLFINILYDRQGLKCTSGVSRKTFVLDKTLEEAWDQEVKERFLTKYL